MAVLRIQGFAGIIPVTGDRALPDNYAVNSVNTWLYGQELLGMSPPADLIDCLATTRAVFRVPLRTVGGNPTYPSVIPPPSYLGDSAWIQFTDVDTDVVKGQLVEDSFERYYFCSPSSGPMFNTYKRMRDGLAAYSLGVPGPSNTLAADGTNANKPYVGSVSGGATPTVSRAYVYTWVNEFGEESAPSLPSVNFTGNATGNWAIGNITDPPANPPTATSPLYTKKYLYRSVTADSGAADFYRVAQIALGTTIYTDPGATYTDLIAAGNPALESTKWATPPANLQGWIGMPNGFLIAWDKPVVNAAGVLTGGNNLYMSEAYHFHAWPAEYKYATETPIVGLGVIGQTCVVATQGYPSTITGTKPATCSFTKATAGEPCLSRGSVVSTPQGVLYASQNGLIMVGSNGIQNITEQLITKEEWGKLYAPQYLRGVRYQNGYLALRMFPPPQQPQRSGFFLDTTDLRVALTELTDFDSVLNLNIDFWSGEVFLIKAGKIRRWDPPDDNLMPIVWLSKEFQYAFRENFGAYAIHWDDARYSNANYGTVVMPTTEKVRLKVLADRQVVYDQLVPKNGRPVRLPSGFKAEIWQFEIRARAPVYSMHVASTMKELKGV